MEIRQELEKYKLNKQMGGIFIDSSLREAASVGSSDVDDDDNSSNEIMAGHPVD